MATSAPPTELVLKFSCPSCGHRLTLPVRKAGMQGPCPKCSQPVSAPPIDSSVSGYDAIAAAVKASMPPPPISPPPPVKETLDELPSHSHSAPVADPVVGRTNRGGFAFPWRARWTWRLIYWGTLFLFLVLFGKAADAHSQLAGTLMLLFLGWLLVGRFVTTLVFPLFHGSFTCPGCHEVHEALNYWTCSCGYVPHRPKHLFSRCPQCGEGAGRTSCPHCGCTMLVW